MDKNKKIQLYKDCISCWGEVSQAFMVMEETGEMLNAFAKAHRGRIKDRMEVITELADVSIMMEQWAAYFGWEEFEEEKERKLLRLQERLSAHKKSQRFKNGEF